MGTRGVYGFRKDNTDKLTYCQFDSYIDGLGYNIVEFIRNNKSELNNIFNSIELIDSDTKPTNTQIEECIQWYDDKVRDGDKDDWYCLLRKSQRDLNAYNNGLKYMIDSQELMKDSFTIDYAYIINLDTNKLEVYVGSQQEPQDNRYYIDKPVIKQFDYYNCKLVKEYDLETVSIGDLENLNEEINREE